MLLRAKESVFLPKIAVDILQIAQSCNMCQTFSRSNRENLMLHKDPQEPWERIGTDFFKFESTDYLLIADYYSQFPIIRRLRQHHNQCYIDVMKQIFSEYGVPEQ